MVMLSLSASMFGIGLMIRMCPVADAAIILYVILAAHLVVRRSPAF